MRWLVRIVFILLLVPQSALAMTSTNFWILWDSIQVGGDPISSSTNYRLRDAIGDSIATTGTSANYQVASGFYGYKGDTLSLAIRAQSLTEALSYTSLNVLARTVTFAIDSSSIFSVGDYIAVIENISSFQQLVAVGKILSITNGGTIITVDRFDGATGNMSASPSVSSVVYRLSRSDVAFGTLTENISNTLVVMASVESDVGSGYTVYVQSDTALKIAGGTNIKDVTDGTVAVGSEEYGASVTGTRAYLPDTDFAVTSTVRAIQTRNSGTGFSADRVPMTFKLALTTATPSGSYAQNVYYSLTANF